MIPRNKIPNELESRIYNSIKGKKETLIANSKSFVKKEKLYGKDCNVYKYSMEFAAMFLVGLIYDEYLWGLNNEWSYYVTKYDLENKRKCLACYGVSLDYYLGKFGLIPDSNGFLSGIENMKIEQTFESN